MVSQSASSSSATSIACPVCACCPISEAGRIRVILLSVLIRTHIPSSSSLACGVLSNFGELKEQPTSKLPPAIVETLRKVRRFMFVFIMRTPSTYLLLGK